MSADLFAEFIESSPPGSRQQGSYGAPQQTGIISRQVSTIGSSGILQGGAKRVSETSLKEEPWPASSHQLSSMSSWREALPLSGAQHGSLPTSAQAQEEDDEDAWGEFVVAGPVSDVTSLSIAPASASASAAMPNSQEQWQDRPQPQGPGTRVQGRGEAVLHQGSSLVDIATHSPSRSEPTPSFSPKRPQSRKPKPAVRLGPTNPNVLFDADDFEIQEGCEYDDETEEDYDDFGEFETVTPAAAPATSFPQHPRPKAAPQPNTTPSIDLLSLDVVPQLTHPPREAEMRPPDRLQGALSFGEAARSETKISPSASQGSRGSFDATGHAAKGPDTAAAFLKSPNPPALQPNRGEEDEWGAWDDLPKTDTRDRSNALDHPEAPDSWHWDASAKIEATTSGADDKTPPPVNVPPPAVILAVFPGLLNSGNALFKPIAGQNSSIKQRVLSHPKAAEFLQGYIALATTAARVMAGRKHRWHRDKLLAKSMSISAAGSKGMKIAGVDKTQSAREDRECGDVVAVWLEHVGRLRSAVAAANAAGKTKLKVPELKESLQVQTVKMVPTAAKPCVICGLKREERVGKVDFDVEDSFGEWWVEHWGHRACKNFWVEHEQKLRQR